MSNAEKKTPDSQDRGESTPCWQWLLLAIPDLWILGIPAVAVVVIVKVFGLPDDFRFAVFIVALIVVLMVGSVVAVYLFGRSFKRGK